MRQRLAYGYDTCPADFDQQNIDVANAYVEEISTWQTTEAQPMKTLSVSPLKRYMYKHIAINAVGLVLTTVAIIYSAFIHNLYAVAISLTLAYGFMEMLVTVIVDKRTTTRD